MKTPKGIKEEFVGKLLLTGTSSMIVSNIVAEIKHYGECRLLGCRRAADGPNGEQRFTMIFEPPPKMILGKIEPQSAQEVECLSKTG